MAVSTVNFTNFRPRFRRANFAFTFRSAFRADFFRAFRSFRVFFFPNSVSSANFSEAFSTAPSTLMSFRAASIRSRAFSDNVLNRFWDSSISSCTSALFAASTRASYACCALRLR